MEDQHKGIWVGVVALAIIGALALWWIAASQPISTWTDMPYRLGSASGLGGPMGNTGIPMMGGGSRVGSDVVSIAENITGASTFGSWLVSTGVGAQIRGAGPYTIFVPTDKAISTLPAGTFTNLSSAERRRFVQYHVISGRAVDVDAQISGGIAALSGDALNFSNINNIPMVGSAIVIAEYKASNGIVYLVSGALVPPKR